MNIDYHVEVENNLYSVPYQLIHEKVEARVTASVVEVLFKGKRVASHPARKERGTTPRTRSICHIRIGSHLVEYLAPNSVFTRLVASPMFEPASPAR